MYIKATREFLEKEILQKTIDIELEANQYYLIIERLKSHKGFGMRICNECRKRIMNLKEKRKEVVDEHNKVVDELEALRIIAKGETK